MLKSIPFLDWFQGLKWGDGLVLLAGIGIVLILFKTLWLTESASKVQIRAGNEIFTTQSLNQQRTLDIPGPLGTTVVIIDHGRARVASDPGPRQYCVKQGWLKQAGEVAMCLPNQVSVELLGNSKPYDTLNY
jgi:hypothetical protein